MELSIVSVEMKTQIDTPRSKARQLALPDGEVIDTTDPDSWEIPVGGVTIKHFFWQNKVIETRFLVRHDDDTFGGYSYEWDESQSEATLVPREGRQRELSGGLLWEYPSRSNCMRCHSEEAGYTLSLESRQLNVLDADNQNQIARLAQHGFLDTQNPQMLDALPTVAQLTDDSISIGQRATSWLHVNCSSCHRGPETAGRATWDARYSVSLADRRVCNAAPFETVGVSKILESILAPNAHGYSTMWLRAMSRGTPYSMPPIASSRVDEAGVDLLAQWIDSVSVCPPLGDSLPGRVLAQHYERSFDLSHGNIGTSAACNRGDNVDIEAAVDQDGECSIVFTDPGEWVEYDVHVSESRDYTLSLRVASGFSPNDRVATMQLRIDDDIVASDIPVPANGWSNYDDIEVTGIELDEGNHVLRLTFSSGFVNLNHFEVR